MNLDTYRRLVTHLVREHEEDVNLEESPETLLQAHLEAHADLAQDGDEDHSVHEFGTSMDVWVLTEEQPD